MKQRIATPSGTKAVLEKYDLYTKKNYGQNFLIECGIVEKIARHAVISDHCAVIEIGPGIGALTQYLCEYAQQVIAFEIDRRLEKVLQDNLCDYNNFTLVMSDFLSIDLKEYIKPLCEAGLDVVVAANLPYYITTPILFRLFEYGDDIKAITVMMQKEVADRFNAEKNAKDYNALSVITQYRCEVQKICKVPANVFQPKPKVDSAVLQFRFRSRPQIHDEAAFFELIKECFRQRRKTILNNYGDFLGNKEKAREILEKAEIPPETRAQGLELSDFIRLYEVHYDS